MGRRLYDQDDLEWEPITHESVRHKNKAKRRRERDRDKEFYPDEYGWR